LAHTSPNSHLPYAIRYMARLQEQAAQAGSVGVPAERLEKCADHLRVTARTIGQPCQPLSEAGFEAPTQKIKLLHFLRQQK